MSRQIYKTYKKTKPQLLNYVKSKIGAYEEAEDILQDVFEKLLENYNTVEPIDNMIAWLYKVASNKIIDFFRKKKTVPMENEIMDLVFADDRINIENEIDIKDLIDLLFQYIDELPDIYKTVIIENSLKGKSFKTLSQETNTSINTLLSRKKYALEKLRKTMKNNVKIVEFFEE